MQDGRMKIKLKTVILTLIQIPLIPVYFIGMILGFIGHAFLAGWLVSEDLMLEATKDREKFIREVDEKWEQLKRRN